MVLYRLVGQAFADDAQGGKTASSFTLRLRTVSGKESAATTTACPPGGGESEPRMGKKNTHLGSRLYIEVEPRNLHKKEKGRVSGGLKRGLWGID
jgi:hypothetical protein